MARGQGVVNRDGYRERVPPTPEQLAEARVVAEDLTYLMDEWVPRLDAAELRRSTSTLLRRLLADGQYARAWRTLDLPGQPYVSSPDLDEMLGSIDRTLIQIAFAPPSQTVRDALANAGGQLMLNVVREVPVGSIAVVLPGYVQGVGILLAVIPEDRLGGLDQHAATQQHISSQLGRRVTRARTLGTLLSSPAALVADHIVTREDVIKYVANKLGGAHFDPRRAGASGERLALLDQVPARLNIGEAVTGFTAIYAEVLSIAESLAESGDAARFRDTLARFDRTVGNSASLPPT
jgi:hypothetical protein